MATLAELRARKQKQKSRPTRVRRVTLDIDLLADVQRLEEEKRDLLTEASRRHDDDEGNRNPDGSVKKMGQGGEAATRLGEIEAELRALYDRLRESEGEILLRGIAGGEWQRWKDDHPPREGNVTDAEVAFGLCNATDVLDDLGRYVASWNGEDLEPGDWDGWLRDSIAPGDLRDLVSDVVSMHEVSGVRAPKSSTASSETETGSSD